MPVDIVGAVALIVMPTTPVVELLPASVALTVIELAPDVVGVPVTTQPVPSDRPDGSAPPTIEQL